MYCTESHSTSFLGLKLRAIPRLTNLPPSFFNLSQDTLLNRQLCSTHIIMTSKSKKIVERRLSSSSDVLVEMEEVEDMM
jgi:hypothetical protein